MTFVFGIIAAQIVEYSCFYCSCLGRYYFYFSCIYSNIFDIFLSGTSRDKYSYDKSKQDDDKDSPCYHRYIINICFIGHYKVFTKSKIYLLSIDNTFDCKFKGKKGFQKKSSRRHHLTPDPSPLRREGNSLSMEWGGLGWGKTSGGFNV